MGYIKNVALGPKTRPVRFGMVFLALMSGCLCFCLAAAAAEELELGLEGEEPTRITSQKLMYNQASKEVEFFGDVHVVRPDFELWCQRMQVFLVEKKAGTDNSRENPGIDKIVAREAVRLEMEDRQAESEEAVYEAASQVLTLKGGVMLKEGLNEIQGEKVVFYLEEKRSEIYSSEGKQVNAVFYSTKDEE